MDGFDNNQNGIFDGNGAANSYGAEASNQPEAAHAATSGEYGPIDIDALDDTNNMLEEMERRGRKGTRICNISCLSGGILGTLGIGLCTVAACIFFGTAKTPSYAVGFPNGTTVGDISSYEDEDGRTHYDIELGDGTSSSDSSNNTPDSSGDQQAGVGDSEPSGDISDNNSGMPGDTDNSSGTSTDDNSSQTPPEEDDPGQGDASGDSEQGDTSGDNGNDTSGGSSEPVRPMPGTGEPSGQRVTALMESELLRSQEKRVADGGNRYLASDIEIDASSRTLSDICAEYGFSEEFVVSYNNIGSGALSIVRLPRI